MKLFIASAVLLAPALAYAAPTWCAVPGVKRISSGSIDNALESDDPRDALVALVDKSCSVGAEEKRRAAEIDQARARWSARLGITDWTDVAQWAVLPTASRNASSIAWDPKRPAPTDPLDQYAFLGYTTTDTAYAADTLGGALTATGRLAVVTRCLADKRPGAWAMCQPDLDALDPTKVLAEVRADTAHTGVERMIVRITLDLARKPVAERAAAVKSLAAKDPGYAKLFALAATTHKDWAAHPPDGKLLATVLAMDDARATHSNKAFEGCEDRTWDAFVAAVGAIPAKKFEHLKDEPGGTLLTGITGVVLGDRDGYLASVALVTCRDKTGDVLTRFLADGLVRWPGFRGPRSASLTAMVTANISLDDRDARIGYPEIHREFGPGGGSMRGGGRGAVAAIKPDGAKVRVEFVKKPRAEQVCANWRDTNRISMISASGTVYYEYECLAYKTITVDDASEPQSVNTRYAGAVKAGTLVSIAEDVVVAVWAKPNTPPLTVVGVPVK